MVKPTTICVYCGGKPGSDPAYMAAAKELGEAMATGGYRMIYGGGGNGIMGQVSNAAMASGGEVIGVIPDFLVEWEVANTNITKQIITKTMHERKQITSDEADAFIFLPGGIGTLDEFFETVAWCSLKIHNKPMVLLNIENYWQPLWDLIEHVKNHDFLHNDRNMPVMADSVTDALHIIKERLQKKD